MKKLLVSLVYIPFCVTSQQFYNTEDYFTRYNPSGLSKKDIYVTGLFNLSDVQSTNNHFTYLNYKQKFKNVSFGLNGDYQQFSSIKAMRVGLQFAYSWKISRAYTLNSGLGLNMCNDNLLYYNLSSANHWNPSYFGFDVGVSIVSKKFGIGVSSSNIFTSNRFIETTKMDIPMSFTAFGSYDFNLDSSGNFHLVPSIFVEFYSRGLVTTMYNLRFDFKSNTIGTGFNRGYISLFYQYQFKNKINLGVSLGRYRSILGNGMDGWNPMIRLNYQFLKINKHVSPNF